MDRTFDTRSRQPWSRAPAAAVALLLLLIGTVAILNVVIRSPFAASKTAGFLSRALGQPVTVGRLSLNFPGLTIQDLVIKNPPGCAEGRLASFRSATIVPRWADIAAGKISFDSVTVRGLTIEATRDHRGHGNFSPLIEALTAKKKGSGEGAETVVRNIVIEAATIRVNGTGVDDLSIHVTDLATRGSMIAAVDAVARHAAGQFHVHGTVRPGKDLEANVALDAPVVAMGQLLPQVRWFRFGTGNVAVHARVDPRCIVADIAAEVRDVQVPMDKQAFPLAGTAKVRLRYDRQADTLRLAPSTIRINGVVAATATGEVADFRGSRKFEMDVRTSPVSLPEAAAQLPPRVRDRLDFTGRILPGRFIATGDREKGIVSARGEVALREGGAKRGGRVIARGVNADVRFEKTKAGWTVVGAVANAGVEAGEGAVVSDLTGTLRGEFTNNLRLVMAEVPELSAQVGGSSVSGSAVYSPSGDLPLRFSLRLPRMPLAALNPVFGNKTSFTAGTLSASLDATGTDARRIHGTFHLRLTGAAGTAGNTPFAAGIVETSGAISRVGENVSVTGRLNLGEGVLAGRTVAGSLRYSGTKDEVSVEDARLNVAGADVSIARLDGVTERGDLAGSFPVHVTFAGIHCSRREQEVRNLHGTADGVLHREAGSPWFEGGGEIRGCDLFLRKRKITSVRSRFAVGSRSADADVEGTVFGGRMWGKARVDMTDTAPVAEFSTEVIGADAADISATVGGGARPAASAGRLDANVRGRYSRASGLSATAAVQGAGLNIVGKSEKNILSDASFSVRGDVARGTLTIADGRLTVAPQTSAAFAGEIIHPFSSERNGEIRLTLPGTPVDRIVEAVVNILPRPVQEASFGGTVGAKTVVRLKGEDVKIDGTVELADSVMEIPRQNLTVSGVRGTVPFSIVRGRPAGKGGREEHHPGRDDYQAYLQFLQFGPYRGSSLEVDKVRFGALELGHTVMQLEASEGVVHVNSFRSSLAGGMLLGRGYFSTGSAPRYGGDMLVNGLSLRAICASFPGIKGYISGKVDGIVSMAGTGKGKGGVAAFAELWAREAKDEKMLVNKEFLQKLAGKNLRGIFFRDDRPYDHGEIGAYLENRFLTFSTLDISNTNFFGVRDLSVTVAPGQNRISMDHLIDSVRQAAARGKAVKGAESPEPPAETEFKWEE